MDSFQSRRCGGDALRARTASASCGGRAASVGHPSIFAEGSAMSPRERLLNRRASIVFELELHGLKYTATVSHFADGRVAEIFLQNHKPGSQSDSNARDSAVAASLALQFGCPLKTLQRAVLRDSAGRPSTPLGAALDRIAGVES